MGFRRLLRVLSLRSLAGCALLTPLALTLPTTASADTAPAPAWALRPTSQPTTLSSAAAAQQYQILLTNIGAATSTGTATVTDTLPAGVTTTVQARGGNPEEGEWSCTPAAGLSVLTCTFPAPVAAFSQAPTINIPVAVAEGPEHTGVSFAHASGGGAPAVSVSTESPIDAAPAPFGLAGFTEYLTASDGTPDSTAAGHPYAFTVAADVNTVFRTTPEDRLGPTSVNDVKDVIIDLPPGLLASSTATPTCTFAQLTTLAHCPRDTQIGHLLSLPMASASVNGPLYDMVPEHGVSAEFGFLDALHGTHVLYASLAPTPAGYVLRVTFRELPQITLTDLIATIYGDPAAANESPESPRALLTNPARCSGEGLSTTVHLDSWQVPATLLDNGTPPGEPHLQDPNWVTATASQPSPPVTGCGVLRFQPSAFSAKPDTAAADSPTGLTLDLQTPQTVSPLNLGTPPLRDLRLTLPEGLTIDPSAAGGLQACTEAQIGWQSSTLTDFTPAAPACPQASEIGSVEAQTALIAGTLHGSLYLATQDQNPLGALLGVYVVIDDPTTGVLVKIAGELRTDPLTGQITADFDELPQLPLSDLKLRLSGGPRGLLATPESCGTFTTTSDLTPWSAPQSGPDATPSDSFQIDTGCSSGFAPVFSAGTVNPQAGASSPLTLSFSRSDSEQDLGGLTVTLPPGLLANLAGVAQCSDAQLAAAASNSAAAEQTNPSCPASSQLGTVQTLAGPGPSPFPIPGRAYLTGPYKGAPYGVALIVPALAGPFDLGTDVIRQALYIDPTDAHVTDVSDPLPTILRGIPLRIKSVDLTLDRPGFISNPTSCQPMAIAASAVSSARTQASISSRFQAANCAGLEFKPRLTASTPAHASMANGAGLVVKIAYPQAAPGPQASLAGVKLDLPRQLSAKLTTIQKACLAATFQSNPAACPPASVIGHATVHTPILTAPLTGPLYFVSYGGERFPDVVMLLQGSGVTVRVTGQTLIDKGVTSVDFASTPDVPIQSLEVDLPSGPYSELGANLPASARFSFCGQKLKMPTLLRAQNGLQLKQSTPVTVQGCSKRISLSHTLRGHTLTVSVYVPEAGKLKLSAKGLSPATRTAKAQENVTVALKVKRKDHFATKLRLTFSPSKGPRQAKTISLKA